MSVDGGMRVSVDGGMRVILLINAERFPLWIVRSKRAGSEKSSGVSLLFLVLLGMHLNDKTKIYEIFRFKENLD